jgi:ArsR family transcriptional regulator
MTARADIFDRMDALADGTRSRLLLVLEGHEMTVSELRSVLQLPQSTVSRHLKILADEGWVTSRPDGSSHRYRMATHRLHPAARELWQLVRAEVQQTPTAVHDAARVRSVVGARRTKSREFFSSAAGQWDGLRRELFGSRPELGALPALFGGDWVVGDLGSGTGQLAEALSPFVAKIIAVDESPAMLEAARVRLANWDNVEFRRGELEALPIGDQELDVAILSLVLHYAADPACTLAEAQRALRAGGQLLIIDMMPHERQEYQTEMGHVWQGFSEEQISGWLGKAGFDRPVYHTLPPDPDAKGPTLFAASASRSEAVSAT